MDEWNENRADIIGQNGNDGLHYTPEMAGFELTYKEHTEAKREQVGGTHYSRMKIQPIDFIMENELSYLQGNIIKYVCRYQHKGKLVDLKKAKQYLEMLMEKEYGVGQRKFD